MHTPCKVCGDLFSLPKLMRRVSFTKTVGVSAKAPAVLPAAYAAESALFDIIALLDASVAPKAEPLAAEFLEYLDYMDYNKYFDSMPTRKVGAIAMYTNSLCINGTAAVSEGTFRP